MTLLALVGVEIAVNSRFDGGKASVPSSRWTASSAAIDARERRDRVGRAVRVGDVALDARHLDPHVDRAAAADLDRVAEPVDRGRLADQDHVGPDLPLVQPVDDPRRAVGRIAFLVAGDQQRQRAALSARSATAPRRRRRSRSSCRWRRGRPARPSSIRASNGSPLQPSPGGNHVEMAGKAEMRRALRRGSRPCSRSARRAARPSPSGGRRSRAASAPPRARRTPRRAPE